MAKLRIVEFLDSFSCSFFVLDSLLQFTHKVAAECLECSYSSYLGCILNRLLNRLMVCKLLNCLCKFHTNKIFFLQARYNAAAPFSLYKTSGYASRGLWVTLRERGNLYSNFNFSFKRKKKKKMKGFIFCHRLLGRWRYPPTK